MMTELTAADGHRFGAYVAGPEDAKHALVIVQEIFGVNSHMRRVADSFATAGYRVICPALFDRVEPGVELGYQPADVKRGLELRAGVTEQAVLLDIQAAADALPAGIKRGIVGYCWGGTVAWYGATRSNAFAAACGWYGGGIAAAREEVPHCPVQLHFGEQDGGIPMTDVAAIREAQPGVQIFTYPDAGHGFGCEQRGSHVEADAQRAQERTLRFFAAHLA